MEKRRKNHKYIISFVFLIVLIALTFFVLLKDYQFSDVKDALNQVSFKYIFYAIGMFFIYLLFEALSTKALLKGIGYPTGLTRNIRYAAVDFYFCAITPSSLGGQPMAAYYMEKDGIPIHQSSVALLVNSIVFRTVLIIYGIAAVILRSYYLVGTFEIVLFLIGASLNLIFISMFILSLVSKTLIMKIGQGIINFLHKVKILKKPIEHYREKFERSVNKYVDSYNEVRKNKFLLLKVLLFNILQRGALFFISYLVYRSFGLSGEKIFSLMAIQILITITVDSLPIPGGVGLSEKMMILLYGFIYVENLVFPAMIITRILNYYLGIILTGGIILIHHVISTIQKRRENDRIL